MDWNMQHFFCSRNAVLWERWCEGGPRRWIKSWRIILTWHTTMPSLLGWSLGSADRCWVAAKPGMWDGGVEVGPETDAEERDGLKAQCRQEVERMGFDTKEHFGLIAACFGFTSFMVMESTPWQSADFEFFRWCLAEARDCSSQFCEQWQRWQEIRKRWQDPGDVCLVCGVEDHCVRGSYCRRFGWPGRRASRRGRRL